MLLSCFVGMVKATDRIEEEITASILLKNPGIMPEAIHLSFKSREMVYISPLLLRQCRWRLLDRQKT